MKNRISNSQKKDLFQLATKLPPIRLGKASEYICVGNIKLDDLIRLAKEKDNNFERIGKKTRLEALATLGWDNSTWIKRPLMKNHYKNILKLWRKGGIEKVYEYIVRFQDAKHHIIIKKTS